MKRNDLASAPGRLSEAARFLELHLDVLRGLQNAAADRAQKYLLLTNSGAVVATLSFIWTSAAARQHQAIWWALAFFLSGVIVCGLLTAITYHRTTGNLLGWIRDADRFYSNEIELTEVPSNLNTSIKKWRWLEPTAGYVAFLAFIAGSVTVIQTVSLASQSGPSLTAPISLAPTDSSRKDITSQVGAPPSPPVGEGQGPARNEGAPSPGPHGSAQSPLVVRILPADRTVTELEQESRERNEKREQARKLVDFNGDLAYYTKILAIVAGLQFLALGAQVVFLRLAFREARRAGDIARDAMIAGERAFVFALGVRAYFEPDSTTNTYHWRFRPVWKNSGDTPTRNMVMHSECVVRTSPLPSGFDFDYQTSKMARALIPPGTEVLGGIAPMAPDPAISPQDILDAQQGKKYIFIWGWARYSDVFPDTPQHITRFCWLVTPLGDPSSFDPKNPDTATFPTIHHMEGNCADEECVAAQQAAAQSRNAQASDG